MGLGKYLSYAAVAVSFAIGMVATTYGQPKSGPDTVLALRVVQVGEATVEGSKDFAGKRFTAVLLDIEGRSAGASMVFNATGATVAGPRGNSVPASVLFFVNGYEVLKALVVGPDEARYLGLRIRVGQKTFDAFGGQPLARQLIGSGEKYTFTKIATVRTGFLFPVGLREVDTITLLGKRLPLSGQRGAAGTTVAPTASPQKDEDRDDVYKFKNPDYPSALLGAGSKDVEVTSTSDGGLKMTLKPGGNLASRMPVGGGSPRYFPDAPGSTNVAVTIDPAVGYTEIAGLRFAQVVTLNILMDGRVEADKGGVEASDTTGARWISKNVKPFLMVKKR